MNALCRSWLKVAAHYAATVAVAPELASFAIRAVIMGPDRALQGSTQLLALVPGVLGQYARRAFLTQVLAECDRSATVEFGTVFSRVGARLRENVYVGPCCHIGLAHIGRNTLLAAGVHVPSGARTHGISDPFSPARSQPGERIVVTIGEGCWVGSAAVVMANVGSFCVVGAGAVVTRTIADRSVALGVPARATPRTIEPASEEFGPLAC